jgi:hypothetical protein
MMLQTAGPWSWRVGEWADVAGAGAAAGIDGGVGWRAARSA